jgi:DNA-binding NtrC family response regulator
MRPNPDPSLPFHTEALRLLASEPLREASALAFPAGLPLDLDALERLAIAEALRRTCGNRTHAARLLGIGLRTLRNKLREERERWVAPPPACASQEARGSETMKDARP